MFERRDEKGFNPKIENVKTYSRKCMGALHPVPRNDLIINKFVCKNCFNKKKSPRGLELCLHKMNSGLK